MSMKKPEPKAYQAIAEQRKDADSADVLREVHEQGNYDLVRQVSNNFKISNIQANYAVDSIGAEDTGFAYFIHRLRGLDFKLAVDEVAQLIYSKGEANAYTQLIDLAKESGKSVKKIIDNGLDCADLEWASIDGDQSLNTHKVINMSSLDGELGYGSLKDLTERLYSSSDYEEVTEETAEPVAEMSRNRKAA